MELRRRFVFRGSAAAFGGRIVRPDDVVFEMPGASALPVSGGRSVSRIPRTDFKGFAGFESASTFAEGLIDDRDGAIALSNHQVREDSLRTTTRGPGTTSTSMRGRPAAPSLFVTLTAASK